MGDLLEWAARVGTGAVVELVCPDLGPEVVPAIPGSTPVVWTGCLAGAPAALPFELLTLKVALVVIRADTCADPAALHGWEDIIAAFELPGVEVVHEAPSTAGTVTPQRADAMPIFTRRGLIGLLAGEVRRDAALTPSGSPHQRLRAVLRQRVTPRSEQPADAVDGLARPGVGLVLEAPGCDTSGVCVRTCPEDALRIERHGPRATLLLDPGGCSGCGACLEACPTSSLRVLGRASWGSLLDDEPRTVAETTTRTCARCRVPFRQCGEQDLCAACAQRRAHPFGSVLPDEVRRRLSSAGT